MGYNSAFKGLNCRSIYSRAPEFWLLVDTYNPNVIVGPESWLREVIGIRNIQGGLHDF